MHGYPKELLQDIENYLHLPQALALSESVAFQVAKEVGFTMWNISEYEKYNLEVPARHGDLDTLIWLHQRQCDLNYNCIEHAMNSAAASGHLRIFQWLHERRSEGCSKEAMNYAADTSILSNGCMKIGKRDARRALWIWQHVMDILKWLHENWTEGCTNHAIDNAARNEHYLWSTE